MSTEKKQKDKTVGIITICKCNNYGAELQAFATARKLQLMGYDAELIDYIYYKSWKFHNTNLSIPFIKMTHKQRMLSWAKYRLINFFLDNIGCLLSLSVRRRKQRFYSFHKQNTPFSKDQYCSMDELYRHPPFYKVYMTGSDQVWNPSAASSIEPYFLTFAPQNAQRISYGASFGISNLPDALKPRYKKYLSHYKHISVREDTGNNIIYELLGKNVPVVLDPTLLLDKEEWRKAAKKYPNTFSHYVLIYQLSESTAIINLAQRISRERKIPIIRIAKRAFWVKKYKGISNVLDAGPAEFVSLIDHADYVITNSFHGTAFSINFHKPFWTIVSNKKENNSRMTNLLRIAGLQSRLITEDKAETLAGICDHINYCPVMGNMRKAIASSEMFLCNSLG